jgi:hypothetical protein
VPFARRTLARQRQQMLSTMVMLGMQRIVIESGRLNAAMRFHIDTRSDPTFDRVRETRRPARSQRRSQISTARALATPASSIKTSSRTTFMSGKNAIAPTDPSAHTS